MIEFRKITWEDLNKIYEWRNQPHMKFWDKDGISLQDVEKKYESRISWEDSCLCYIASDSWTDFWLIQYYRNTDEPEYAEEIWVTDGVSIDLFIGNEDFLWKGYWKKMLGDFVDKIFSENSDILTVYICHEDKNLVAIACSKSVGFMFMKDVVEDSKPSKLYKIVRKNV